MFTGIVQCLGRIHRATDTPFGKRIVVDPGHRSMRPEPGASICISGVCLTLAPGADDPEGMFGFDVIGETLNRTTLGELEAGCPVNLEPSLTPATPMGGHFVQGHVDAVVTVGQVTPLPDCRIRIRLMDSLRHQVVPKGSVAVDGVSLTVAAVGQDSFEVALIPTTRDLTTLGSVQTGSRVNLETDLVSKTIVHWLEQRFERAEPLTLDHLRRAGFVD